MSRRLAMVGAHPDHRYTSQLVGDVSYLLKVPHCCPDVPALRKDTVHAFFHAVRQTDRPDAFAVAIDVDDLWPRKVEVMAQHESQFFEWLPWINGEDLAAVPPADDQEGRLVYIDCQRRPLFTRIAGFYRDRLCARYGNERGKFGRSTSYFGLATSWLAIRRCFAASAVCPVSRSALAKCR